MAGKRRHEDNEGDRLSLEDKEEERLLSEEDSSSVHPHEDRQEPSHTSASLDRTLERLDENMSRVAESMVSLNRAVEKLTQRPGERPSKRQRIEALSDPDNEEEDVDSSEEDTLALLADSEREKSEGEKTDLLDDIAMELDTDEQTDSDVSEKLAKIVNKRWTEKLSSNKLSEKFKKHSRPGNLKALIVPKVNPEIWLNMSHAVKREDLRRANIQTSLSKVGSILVKSTDKLLEAHKNNNVPKLDELISYQTDALAMLGHAQVELSLKRRDAILKPTLKKEYAGLRSQNIPVTSLLFGDDLQQQLKNIKASNQVTQTAATSSQKGQRTGFKGHHDSQWKHKRGNDYRRKYRNEYSKNSRFPLHKKKERGGKN